MDKIPKILFQIWIGNNEIPKKYTDCIKSVKNYHPHWQYKLITTDEADLFVKLNYTQLYEIYKEFQNIQKADLLRYLLLWKYGGVYLDLKFKSNKPLDDFEIDPLKEVYFIRSFISKNTYTNSVIFSKKNSRFWDILINEIITNSSKKYFLNHMLIFNTTGPFILNSVIKKNPQYVGECKNLVSKCNYCYPTVCKKHYYLDYGEGGIWHSWDSKLFKKLYCYRFILLLSIFVFINFFFFIIK